jgi:hypothetical protein
MGMIELDITMDNDLITKTRDLAIRYFGDDSDASLSQVLEVAFRMRCLWSRCVKLGQQDIDEVMSTWEFSESTIKQENNSSIQDWLFRR